MTMVVAAGVFAARLALTWGAGPFVVALDAGHGGSNRGAEAAATEKQVTLDIVQRAARKLAGRPRLRVVVCRASDVLVPVRARVRCANEAGADLFVSVHANASPLGPRRGTQSGFELYVLPLEAVDQEAAAAAALAADDASAAAAAERVRAVARESLEAAHRLALELGDARGRDASRGVKQQGAALDVLTGLSMPGVLVEVGFLDHPVEGPFLASPEGREELATALARALSDLGARAHRAASDPTISAP